MGAVVAPTPNPIHLADIHSSALYVTVRVYDRHRRHTQHCFSLCVRERLRLHAQLCLCIHRAMWLLSVGPLSHRRRERISQTTCGRDFVPTRRCATLDLTGHHPRRAHLQLSSPHAGSTAPHRHAKRADHVVTTAAPPGVGPIRWQCRQRRNLVLSPTSLVSTSESRVHAPMSLCVSTTSFPLRPSTGDDSTVSRTSINETANTTTSKSDRHLADPNSG